MKTNQTLIVIWLLLAGVSIPMTGNAKHCTTSPAPDSTKWQSELSDYLDHLNLSDWMDKSTAIVSFRLDEHHCIQDVIVIAKDQDLVRNISRCLRGRRMLNPCPTIIDQSGNERCTVWLHFDMQS